MVSNHNYRQRLKDSPYAMQASGKKHSFKKSLFVLVLILFTISLFIYVFPEVDVTVVPATESAEHNFEITLQAGLPQADYVKNIFPAKIIETEDSLEKTFIATGEKNVGDKAAGKAVFFNQTGLVQPLTTTNSLVTDDGIVFYVQQNVDIPKAEVSPEGNIIYGSITVPIIAAEAGERGNVGPGRLTITDLPFSKQNKIYAEIQTKLVGGSDKVIKVVSEDDLQKAERKLIDELKPKLKQLLRSELGNGETLNEDLLKYETIKVDKVVELDEEVDNFKMKVTLKAKALIWNNNQVRQMILNKIKAGLSSGKKLVKSSRDLFQIEIEKYDLDKGTAVLKIITHNQISLPIKIDKLKEKLKGLKEYEARRLLLSQKNIKDVRFKFRYSLTSRIPKNGNRINIKLAVE